ncbi:hydrolase [Acidobacterium sp. S8]|uniref:hydrolase n=1 Tax=Acidobacterium sp. S8 TaxID=1641854 RepID=UPI00131E51BE|nr:hydrolase [Acidobacterium sp. S8]
MTSISLDPKTTALVLIDLQHGIVARPVAPHSGQQVVENSARLAAALRKAGGTVMYVHVLISEALILPSDSPTRDPNAPPPPPIASELVPEAGMQEGDVIIAKRQWGAFYGTGLEQQLRRRDIQTIIMGGVATNFGVESTARAAFDQGYHLVFAEDAMSSVSAEAHQFAIQQIFPRMGRVRSTEEVLASLVK